MIGQTLCRLNGNPCYNSIGQMTDVSKKTMALQNMALMNRFRIVFQTFSLTKKNRRCHCNWDVKPSNCYNFHEFFDIFVCGSFSLWFYNCFPSFLVFGYATECQSLLLLEAFLCSRWSGGLPDAPLQASTHRSNVYLLMQSGWQCCDILQVHKSDEQATVFQYPVINMNFLLQPAKPCMLVNQIWSIVLSQESAHAHTLEKYYHVFRVWHRCGSLLKSIWPFSGQCLFHS